MKRNVIFLLSICCVVLLVACRQCSRDREPVVFSKNPVPEYDTAAGLILYLQPGKTPQEAISFLTVMGTKFNRNFLKDLEYCLPCDSQLFRIKGFPFDSLKVYASTGDADVKQSMPPSKTGANGEWGPFYYSPSYRIRNFVPGSIAITPGQQAVPGASSRDTVTVGVLDTGIDTALNRLLHRPLITACQPGGGSGFGWNFNYNSGNADDDFNKPLRAAGRGGHGTPVTGFILQQNNGGPYLRIVPVKALDSAGVCGLFELMCGLKYAQKAGARIINASLGFYSPYTDQVALFDSFVKDLTQDGTILVVSAGNTHPLADSIDSRRSIDPIATADLRNIDKHLFYPAGFSENNPNILTVTTVQRFPGDSIAQNLPASAYRYQVVDSQNYSPAKVQIGVRADAEKYFRSPFSGSNATWQGSSFAAPIVTGLLAANYYNLGLNRLTGLMNRNDVLARLMRLTTGLPNPQAGPGSQRPLPAFAITTRKLQPVPYSPGSRFVVSRNLADIFRLPAKP